MLLSSSCFEGVPARRALQVAFWLVSARPLSAHAADGGRDPALAQALFEEAQRLVKTGDYAHACPKFKGSYEADPGGGTLLNLADCYEKQGKLALAWSTFKEARVMAQRDGRSERVEFAEKHVQALEARLPRLTVAVASPAEGLSISIDGTPLREAAWGVALPIDPGAHTLRATAEGKEPFERRVDIPDGAKVTQVEIPMLADSPQSAAPGGEPPVEPGSEEAGSGSASAGSSSSPSDGMSTKRLVGWVVGGVGVVGIGVGSYFGVRAFSKWEEREGTCPSDSTTCPTSAKEADEQARQAATISTISLAAGLVATGVGAFLILTGGQEKPATEARRTRVTPLLGARSVGLEIAQTW